MNTRKKILPIVASIAALTAGCSLPPEQPVNFVVIYLDDMGYGDLSITGASGFKTPNIDRMAREGIMFTHFYAPQAVCTASRAGLLTGCYPNRLGFSGALDHSATRGINPEEETLAEILKAKNYATAIFGKWHLGHLPEFLPLQHGFDEFYGIPYSNDMWPFHPTGGEYYPPLPLIEGNTTIQTNPDQSLFTQQFTERTVQFMVANQNKPFFAYLAHPMPHVPLFVSEQFAGKSDQGLYGDVMMELDWSVGRIMHVLDSLNLSNRTLVIFTSDNGPWINYGNHAGSTGGLREGKGTTWEGGQRVPAIMWWPGKLPEGSISAGLSSAIDLLPTIAEIAGVALPEQPIDGVSLMPLLEDPNAASPRKTFLYYYRRNQLEAIRYDNWKLVFPHTGRTYTGFEPGLDGQPGRAAENAIVEWGLFDLRRDPGERYNLIDYHPEIVERLNAEAEAARVDLGDDLTGSPGANRRPIGSITE